MKRVLLVVAAALAVPAAAAAKGPSEARVAGPGLDSAIVVRGAERTGTPLMTLAESVGFFPAVYGQSPDPMLRARPKGKLGPKYTITYRVPGPGGTSTIRQDVYPYANPAPVSYMKPGQSFWDGQRSYGGWFVGDARARSTLVRAGLPAAPAESSGGASTGWWIGGIALGLLLVASAALVARRRPRPVAA